MTDPSGAFRSRVAVAAIWAAVQVGGNQVAAFLVFLVLSRLLGPHAIGLVALATIFVDTGAALMRGGLPEALVQRESLSETQADTAFWANLGLAVVLAGAMFMTAGPFASLFSEPDLAPVLRVLAVVLPLMALNTTHEARLTRAFGFKALALRSLFSNVAAGTVGIGMAAAGYGVWSLVAHRLVFVTSMMVCTWIAFPWLPRLRFSRSDYRLLFRFGGNMMVSGLLSALNVRVFELLIGYHLGASAVGLFRLAWRCFEFITQVAIMPLNTIALPTFSRLQADPDGLQRAFVRMVHLAALITFPAFFGAAAIASTVIPFAFGEQWRESALLLQIICLVALPTTVQYFIWPALAAVGRSDLTAFGVFSVVALGAGLAAIIAPWGIVAVAGAYVLRAAMILPLSLGLLNRFVGISMPKLFAPLMAPLLGSLVMAALLLLLTPTLRHHVAEPILVLALPVAGAVLYAGFLLLLAPSAVSTLRQSVALLSSRGGRRS